MRLLIREVVMKDTKGLIAIVMENIVQLKLNWNTISYKYVYQALQLEFDYCSSSITEDGGVTEFETGS